MKPTTLILITMLSFAYLCGCHTSQTEVQYNDTLPVAAAGYVGLQGNHFVIDGKDWFPLMLNHKAFIDGDHVVPASWYTGDDIRAHFDTIASWGFNAVRVCLDVISEGDSTAKFMATRRMVQQADSAGLRVMLLIKTPFEPYWQSYTKGLLRHLSDLPALWAYDFMNEPLYFDSEPDRTKTDALRIVSEWRRWMRTYAPHQLFTIGFAEPIEVFEWDPSLLPVDFIEMHTYHPLRVQAEMWWYSHYCGKPWMVGETGLPADGDSVSYQNQRNFMYHTYRYAKINGACGYGWWEFQDYPDGVNFEAQYTGLRDRNGHRKPAANVATLLREACQGGMADDNLMPPANYYNMLAYGNVAAYGNIVDDHNRPVEGAVVRGWNQDWSVGVNSYSDSTGHFRLVSNDICTHFEISAPGYNTVKFNKRLSYPANLILPSRTREYQQIPLLGWGDSNHILPAKTKQFEASTAVEAPIGKVTLKRLKKSL